MIATRGRPAGIRWVGERRCNSSYRRAHAEAPVKGSRLVWGVLVAVPVMMPSPAEASFSELAYWTPARMAHATPLDPRFASRQAGVPTARAVAGSKVLGALFFNNGSGGHYCTASVIR